MSSMRRTIGKAYALILLAPLALAACSGGGGSPDVAALAGKTLTSTEIVGEGIVTEPPITLTFEDDGIALKGGCNTLFGQGAIENGVLVMATPLASTMMACDQPLMDRDQWLVTMVESAPFATWDGTQLVLESGADRLALRE